VLDLFNHQPTGGFVNKDSKPFANSHQQMLAARVDWEIHQMIIPHVQGKTNCRYPFASHDEMTEAYYMDRAQVELGLAAICDAVAEMPPGFKEAFHYVAMREINAVVQAFVEVTKSCSECADNSLVSA